MQAVEINRLLNRITLLQDRLVKAETSGINRLALAARRDIERGVDPEVARAALEDAYAKISDHLTEQFDQLQEILSAEEIAEETDDLTDGGDRLPDWLILALREFPDLEFGDNGDLCPGGQFHTSPLFTSIQAVRKYMSKVPVFFLVWSDDDGLTFYAIICDRSS